MTFLHQKLRETSLMSHPFILNCGESCLIYFSHVVPWETFALIPERLMPCPPLEHEEDDVWPTGWTPANYHVTVYLAHL